MDFFLGPYIWSKTHNQTHKGGHKSSVFHLVTADYTTLSHSLATLLLHLNSHRCTGARVPPTHKNPHTHKTHRKPQKATVCVTMPLSDLEITKNTGDKLTYSFVYHYIFCGPLSWDHILPPHCRTSCPKKALWSLQYLTVMLGFLIHSTETDEHLQSNLQTICQWRNSRELKKMIFIRKPVPSPCSEN